MTPAQTLVGRGWGWRIRDGLRSGPRRRAAVLVYHRVGDDHPDPLGQVVSQECLESHMHLISRHWNPVSALELVEMVHRGRVEHGSIAVTFDDGYADNLSRAAPIAARFGVPITVFVVSGAVIRGHAFWWDELWSLSGGDLGGTGLASLLTGDSGPPPTPAARLARFRLLQSALDHIDPPARRKLLAEARIAPHDDTARPLTREELGSLAALRGVAIGAHTREHRRLSGIDAEAERDELRSRQDLEAAIGRPVSLLAYPFGKDSDISERTIRAAEEEGYRGAFTTFPSPALESSDPWRIPRVGMAGCDDRQFLRHLASVTGLRATRARR